MNKEELPPQFKDLFIYLLAKTVIKLTANLVEAYHCGYIYTVYYPMFFQV